MEKQTPKKKIILDNNQIQIQRQKIDTPTKSKYQLKKAKKTDLEQAINSLNQLSIPNNIPCRQNQKKSIEDFIRRGVKSLGCSEILYISGVPGIGKTISVLEILQKLKHLQSFQKDTIQININSMNLTRPQHIYSSILYQLTDYKQKNIVKSLNLLNYIFETGLTPVKIQNATSINRMKEAIGKVKIIFIDQLDYLNTKNQQVLYNLFQWPKSKFSKIVMITVSNTIDFPQRIQQKIVSRIGNQRLVFRPYTSDQIQIIIKNRLEAINIFQENAITYACRKIAKFSSDIRKSLLVLRNAVELFKLKKGNSKFQKISVQYISEAHEKIYNDPIIKSISQLPHLVKIVIIKICFQIHLSGKGCWFTQLWYRMSLYNQHLFESSSKVSQILYLLKQLNIVRIKNMNRYKDTRIERSIVMHNNTQELFIELQIDIDQIFNALMNEEELINQIQLMRTK